MLGPELSRELGDACFEFLQFARELFNLPILFMANLVERLHSCECYAFRVHS